MQYLIRRLPLSEQMWQGDCTPSACFGQNQPLYALVRYKKLPLPKQMWQGDCTQLGACFYENQGPPPQHALVGYKKLNTLVGGLYPGAVCVRTLPLQVTLS